MDSSSLYTFTAQSRPLCYCSIPAPPSPSKPLLIFCPLRIFSLCILTTASCSWLFLFASCFLFSSLTPSGFFNRMLGMSKLGALNFYTFFRLILLTLFVSKNLILTCLPFSRSLDSLLCDLIAPTPSLVFFLLVSHTLAAASSFSSSRTYPSLNFLPPLFT